MVSQENVLNERQEKIRNILKGNTTWIILGLLVIAIILGVYIRSLPMTDHGGKPGLWDITTNTWTLGPDLDPWLFTRYAETMVENGSLPKIDMMRNVPLGFDNSRELQMVSYMIILTNKIVSLFSQESVIYAADVMPVIFFGLTIISFFLFVKEIFLRKDEEKSKFRANIISLISTFIMVVIPIFLSRTVAGIPEKESIGFFFMFLAFYLFLRAWKSEKLGRSIILGALAGISTALMGLSWGGVVYVYTTVAIATLIAFLLNKVGKRELGIYAIWIIISWGIVLLFSNRDSLIGLISSPDTGLAFLTLFVLVIHFILWSPRFPKIKILDKLRIPKNVISIILALIIGVIGASLIFGPSFIIDKIVSINQILFTPVTGRWNTTVAENQQPFFTEWAGSFGPFISNIPLLFWLFFIGSVVLFNKMLSTIKRKEKWVLTGLYVLFFLGLVFSRYSNSSIFNGTNFISKLFYYGSALLFVGFIIYYYIKDHKEGHFGFEKVHYELIFLFVLLALCLFTARSAVRLIMVLGPIAPIFFAYFIVFSWEKIKGSKEGMKMLYWGVFILLMIAAIFTFYNFYKDVTAQSYSYVPSYYNQQWQEAMSWVRTNTPSNAVFAHWWDYGYWVQSIGNRATVTDGGNAITWWNYLTGRLVLTGDNQGDSLNFLYNHNASYLLIDSTDISKYGAFSKIGSDVNYDRLSFGPTTLSSDPSSMQETASGIKRAYQGTSCVEGDLNYNLNGTNIFLPGMTVNNAGEISCKSYLIGVVSEHKGNGTQISFSQPQAVFYYNGNQFQIPLRYVYFNNKIADFGNGLGGTAYILPVINANSQTSIQVDDTGAMMYISPRVMAGFLGQVYLLNDPFNNFPNFKLAHSEQNLIIDSLNRNNANLNEFAVFNGQLLGPIKIWNIKYTGNERLVPEYTDISASKYISWAL
jgi:asparagine N-glycosylation enzyme membrane subunit Stt3